MKKSLIVIAVALLTFGGFTLIQKPADCIEVYVDFGPLNGNKVTECISTTADEMSAVDVLRAAGYELEGTQEYGNAVVCRVNGLPDATEEACIAMPSEKSYWAILVKLKESASLPFAMDGVWGWAQVGIQDLHLHRGESIGLVFANNGEVKFP